MTKFTCFSKISKFRARVGLGPRYLKGMSGRAGPRAGGFGLGPGSGYEPIGRCRAGPGFGPTSSGSGRVRAENLGPFNTLNVFLGRLGGQFYQIFMGLQNK